MAKRSFIFRCGTKERVLPVTPDSYSVSEGINVEIVNIHSVGDVGLPGYKTISQINIPCILPNKSYSFSNDSSPEKYISQFKTWIKEKAKVQFIIGGTEINHTVIFENISYGEKDGTNDIYMNIILREYRKLEEVKMKNKPGENKSRSGAESGEGVKNHQIVWGDTLSALCRKYYGDGSKATYDKLAKYNGIPNPDLIYAGNSLKIPVPLP